MTDTEKIAYRVYSKYASGLRLTPAEVVQLSAGAQYPHAHLLGQVPGMFRNWRDEVVPCKTFGKNLASG